MKIKVPQLKNGRFVNVKRESTPEILTHIISKDLGFKFENNTLIWDCAYKMSDDQRQYSEGLAQEQLLERFGLI